LYYLGGLYVDLDVLPGKGCDEFFLRLLRTPDLMAVLASGCPGRVTNGVIVATPFHPFAMEVVTELCNPAPWWACTKHLNVIWRTGPGAVQRVVQKTRSVLTYLPRSVFNAYSWEDTLEGRIIEGAMLHYIPGRSWNSTDSHVFNFIYKNYVFVGLVVVLLLLMAFSAVIATHRGRR
jgi:mannosyltransferase OCH1-like enzyme